MGILLNNQLLTVNPGVGTVGITQRTKPVAPSIAEGAIFIAKPMKRVEFQLELPNSQTAPGQGNLDVNSANNKASGVPKVVMQVITNPEKDFSVWAAEQEGRQINHGKTLNFQQQYDAYGRPRMGDSREPYDFAYTKFMVKTSQLAFNQNIKAVTEASKKQIQGFANRDIHPSEVAGNSNVMSSNKYAQDAVNTTKAANLYTPDSAISQATGSDKTSPNISVMA
jgi:hypothetical protein